MPLLHLHFQHVLHTYGFIEVEHELCILLDAVDIDTLHAVLDSQLQFYRYVRQDLHFLRVVLGSTDRNVRGKPLRQIVHCRILEAIHACPITQEEMIVRHL